MVHEFDADQKHNGRQDGIWQMAEWSCEKKQHEQNHPIAANQ
jgi:hypothetical protein